MALRFKSMFLATCLVLALSYRSAWAEQNSILELLPNQSLANNGVMMIIFVGAFAFAMWSATWLIRERRQLDDTNRSLALEIADLKARFNRAQTLLDAPDQSIVIWDGPDEEPVCLGRLAQSTGAPDDPEKFVKFDLWLSPESSQSFKQAVSRLRTIAEGFDLSVESRSGSVIEVQGRASGPYAFVRFVGLAGDRAALAALELQHTELLQTTETMKSLLEAIPFPVWLRNSARQLTWVNGSYVKAVDGGTLEETCKKNMQLLDASQRGQVANAHETTHERETSSHFHRRLPATISGDRRTMDVSEVSYEGGSAGLAVDMSEVEDARATLRRTLESHSQTLNQLTSAVAIFNENKHLIFYNQAFESLWQLEQSLLDSEPDNGRLFDAMREAGKIAEQPDWSKWRNGLLKVYEETQTLEDWWHLPDNRTLRVIANPHTQGGVTWVFENITEQLEMESRYIALTQVQGETLDHLSEAIAVFASDGKLKLSNPSFQRMWNLSDEQVTANTPMSALAKLCGPRLEEPEVWDRLNNEITGVLDQRKSVSGRLKLVDEAILDFALIPLPNGQTMLSFADVSASVILEHTLLERNEALDAAERLQNAFIEHVSYEFRAPLTSIKGFSEVLGHQTFGPLNERQVEYVEDIAKSANLLHSLVNNILDLATVDAGIMELNFQQITLNQTLQNVADSMSEQLTAKNISLQLKQRGADGTFTADPARIEQVLYNLLSNAVAYSPENSHITLESTVEAETIMMRITDSGPGISKQQRSTIFERFSSFRQGSNRRGAGLGLSIARSLVELHGGTIELDDSHESGTSFVCRLPKAPKTETLPADQAAQ